MSTKCRCGGTILELDKLFICENCQSKVWRYFFSKELKIKDAVSLLNDKIIILKGIKSSSGTLYDTKVHLNNGELKLIFDQDTKSTKICNCSCGGEVNKIPKGYKCQSCEKIVWEKFVNRVLKPYEVKQLFKGESLFLKNLKSKQGNIFNAEIYLEGEQLALSYL